MAANAANVAIRRNLPTQEEMNMADDPAKKPDLKVVPNKDPATIFDDLAALRKASKLTVKRKTVLVQVPVGKPPNNVHFRTHPTLQLENATVIKDKEGTRDVYYYIVPDMRGHPKLAPRLRWVTIMLTCMWPGNGFLLWPVSEKTDFPAWKSERKAAEIAQTHWTQMVWNRDKNPPDNDVETAENISAEPTWPKESFEQLLKAGFADLIVDNEDHYYVRRLRGIVD
jgi:hypothetical protein